MSAATETRIEISSDSDIVEARQAGRALADDVGFSGTDLTIIATAISELARNIVEYADRGEIVLNVLEDGNRQGIEVVASDRGPGIANVDTALQDGFSTGHSLGLGLPGAKRLMDEMEIWSRVGEGTTVTVRKWVP